MFRRRCIKCNEKISKKFEYCPFCGRFQEKQNDGKEYGLLGKNDEVNEFDSFLRMTEGGTLNKMIAGVMKMLEKELKQTGNLQKEAIEPFSNQKTNFKIYINGRRIDVPPKEIIREMPVKRIDKKKLVLPSPSEKTIRDSINLPRKEAEYSLKRLANKIIYEVGAPGVNSLDKILINKTEEGFEIRVFTKKIVLTKSISVKLPLLSCYLDKQKLFLEFQSK